MIVQIHCQAPIAVGIDQPFHHLLTAAHPLTGADGATGLGMGAENHHLVFGTGIVAGDRGILGQRVTHRILHTAEGECGRGVGAVSAGNDAHADPAVLGVVDVDEVVAAGDQGHGHRELTQAIAIVIDGDGAEVLPVEVALAVVTAPVHVHGALFGGTTEGHFASRGGDIAPGISVTVHCGDLRAYHRPAAVGVEVEAVPGILTVGETDVVPTVVQLHHQAEGAVGRGHVQVAAFPTPVGTHVVAGDGIGGEVVEHAFDDHDVGSHGRGIVIGAVGPGLVLHHQTIIGVVAFHEGDLDGRCVGGAGVGVDPQVDGVPRHETRTRSRRSFMGDVDPVVALVDGYGDTEGAIGSRRDRLAGAGAEDVVPQVEEQIAADLGGIHRAVDGHVFGSRRLIVVPSVVNQISSLIIHDGGDGDGRRDATAGLHDETTAQSLKFHLRIGRIVGADDFHPVPILIEAHRYLGGAEGVAILVGATLEGHGTLLVGVATHPHDAVPATGTGIETNPRQVGHGDVHIQGSGVAGVISAHELAVGERGGAPIGVDEDGHVHVFAGDLETTYLGHGHDVAHQIGISATEHVLHGVGGEGRHLPLDFRAGAGHERHIEAEVLADLRGHRVDPLEQGVVRRDVHGGEGGRQDEGEAGTRLTRVHEDHHVSGSAFHFRPLEIEYRLSGDGIDVGIGCLGIHHETVVRRQQRQIIG